MNQYLEMKLLPNNIVLIQCFDRYLLAESFLRFQEHYESPKFRGKDFSKKEYIEWYKKDSNQKKYFTYHQDWAGFNVPSSIIKAFSKRNTLDYFEKNLISMIPEDIKEKDYYLIGVNTNQKKEDLEEDLAHEIAHGLYFSNKKYQNEINKLIKSFEPQTDVLSFLKRVGYHEAVHLDETHAWVGFSSATLDEKEISYSKDLSLKIKDIFNSHYGN